MVAIEGQNPGEEAAGERSLPKEARRLLHELAAEWADVADCRALEVVPLKGMSRHGRARASLGVSPLTASRSSSTPG